MRHLVVPSCDRNLVGEELMGFTFPAKCSASKRNVYLWIVSCILMAALLFSISGCGLPFSPEMLTGEEPAWSTRQRNTPAEQEFLDQWERTHDAIFFAPPGMAQGGQAPPGGPPGGAWCQPDYAPCTGEDLTPGNCCRGLCIRGLCSP